MSDLTTSMSKIKKANTKLLNNNNLLQLNNKTLENRLVLSKKAAKFYGLGFISLLFFNFVVFGLTFYWKFF
jgi:inner membrane protein involved in colicin E2 resistance